MNTENTKRSILDRAVDAFDLPGEVLAGMPKLTVTGNKRVHIEGHKGILEYDGNLVAVNAGGMVLRIRGEGLDIISMSAQEILVKGLVAGIDFD